MIIYTKDMPRHSICVCVCVCVCYVLSTILIMGMGLEEIQILQAHSAESSVVSRSYATLLIPVHSL